MLIAACKTVTVILGLAYLGMPFTSIAQEATGSPERVDDAGAAWLAEAMPIVMSYNFQTAARHLDAIGPYFTPRGFDSFGDALKASGNIEQVIDRKMVVQAEITCEPVRISNFDQDEPRTRYALPLIMSYQSAAGELVQHLHALVDLDQTADGDEFGIHRIVAAPNDKVTAEDCENFRKDKLPKEP
ncbi:MAG: DotI/IcmL family type IV secretion protein [Pseudomonadota bacterium]